MADIPPAPAGLAQVADPLVKREDGHVADPEAAASPQAKEPRVKDESHDSKVSPLASAAARNPPLPKMKKIIFICGERRVERWIHDRPASRASPPRAPSPPPPAPSPTPASRGRLSKVFFGWGEQRIVQWVREPAADGAPQQPPATPPRPCSPPVLVPPPPSPPRPRLPPPPSPPPRPLSPGPGRKWTKFIVRQGGVVRVNRWVNLPNEEG